MAFFLSSRRTELVCMGGNGRSKTKIIVPCVRNFYNCCPLKTIEGKAHLLN